MTLPKHIYRSSKIPSKKKQYNLMCIGHSPEVALPLQNLHPILKTQKSPSAVTVLRYFFLLSLSSPESEILIFALGLPEPDPLASTFLTTSMPSSTAQNVYVVRVLAPQLQFGQMPCDRTSIYLIFMAKASNENRYSRPT